MAPVEIVSDRSSIGIGMTKYATPPKHSMFFILKGMYSSVTMQGMRFPLDIILMTRDLKIIRQWRGYPSDPERLIPEHTWYMLEIPVQE